MAANLSKEKIKKIKEMAAAGVMGKVIAQTLKVNAGAVSFHSRGIKKPFEHRGRGHHMGKSLNKLHREDRDW